MAYESEKHENGPKMQADNCSREGNLTYKKVSESWLHKERLKIGVWDLPQKKLEI